MDRSTRSLAMAASCIATQKDAGFERQLGDIETPVLIYAGDRDEEFHDLACKAAGVMPSARFVSLPELNHGETFWRIELVAPLLRELVSVR